ncbi:MAG: ATP-binding cassette domain-containing protein, partial [Bdellovibrionota bacterium]|nr:ATP-binding cassette domain-containing protein [Bdellovibrionota bacterium]
VLGISQRKIKKIKGTTKTFYDRIEQDNRIDEKTKENQLKKKEHLESFVNRFRAKASKAKQAQSKMKQLDKLDIRDDYVSEEYLGFRFPYKDCPSKNFLKVEDFHFSYKEGIEIIKGFNLMVRKGDRIAIIGKNGKGKSTLLNLLAEELTPSRGQLSPHPALERGHFGQTNIKRLTETNTIVDEIYASNTDLSQSSVRGICGTMMFSDDLANKKIAVLSGGEKSRVLLGKILATPTNLLLLDEPTNHLDMESVDVLIDQINDFKGASIIVTHNEQLLRKFAKKLIVFHQEKVEVFEGDYDEFLEKIGWEDENNFGAVSENNRKSSWKNNKKLRAEIIKERSKVLGPLKKESEKVEEDICAFEALLSKKNEEIISLSSGGEGQKISLLSKEVKMLENKVDNLFLRLEELTELIENRQKDFEAQLKEIGP